MSRAGGSQRECVLHEAGGCGLYHQAASSLLCLDDVSYLRMSCRCQCRQVTKSLGELVAALLPLLRTARGERIVESLGGIVIPLRGIIKSLRGIIKSLRGIIKSLQVSRLAISVLCVLVAG